MKKNLKIIFFGTPEFVVPLLESLLKTPSYQLLAVVTRPDKPTGRQQILTPSPVKLFAQEHKIKVIDSASMMYIIEAIKKLVPDLGILAAYGKIIPKELIDVFPRGILVIHPSLLPKYRGASPVQAAILSGDKETGVSIIKMDEKMDHGPILAQFKEPVNDNDTAETLRARLFQQAAEVLTAILPAYISGKIKPREQDHQKATFTKLLKKEDGKIDWQWSPEKIERFIRAMTPWPSAWTTITIPFRQAKTKRYRQDKRLKIIKGHIKVLSPKSLVLCLDEVQLEGKKPVSWEEFQKGYPDFKFSG